MRGRKRKKPIELLFAEVLQRVTNGETIEHAVRMCGYSGRAALYKNITEEQRIQLKNVKTVQSGLHDKYFNGLIIED